MDAGVPQVVVQHAMSKQDVYDFYRAMAPDPDLRRLRCKVGLVLVPACLLIAAAALLTASFPLACGALAAVAVTGAQVFGRTWAWLSARRGLATLAVGGRSLAVDAGGVGAATVSGTSLVPWSSVLRVCEADRWIGFVTRQTAKAFLIVPMPAATLGEAERAAIRGWAAAAERPWRDLRRVARGTGARVG
jgi:hypothetical protein